MLRIASKVIAAVVVFVSWASEGRANIILNGGFDTGSSLPFTLALDPNGKGTVGPLASDGGLPVASFDVTGRGASNAVMFNAGATAAAGPQVTPVGGTLFETFTVPYVFVFNISLDVAVTSTLGTSDGGRFDLIIDGFDLASYTFGAVAAGQTLRHTFTIDNVDATGLTSGPPGVPMSFTLGFRVSRKSVADPTVTQYADNFVVTPLAVPEPASAILCGIGLGVVLLARKRQNGTRRALAVSSGLGERA